MAGSEDENPVGEDSLLEQLFIDDKTSDGDSCKDIDQSEEPASDVRSTAGVDSNSLDVDLYADVCPTSEGEYSLGLLPLLGNDDKSTDLDLYTDLLTAESEQQQTAKAEAKEKLGEQIKLLEQLKSVNVRLENQNKHLLRNISVLFTTAKHEIGRKDKQIRELQERLDSMVFRRTNRFNSPNSGQSDEDKIGHAKRDRNNLVLRGGDRQNVSPFRTPASPTTVNRLSVSARTPPCRRYANSSPASLSRKSMYGKHGCKRALRTDHATVVRNRKRPGDHTATNLNNSPSSACTSPEIHYDKKRKISKLKKCNRTTEKCLPKTDDVDRSSDKSSKVESSDSKSLMNYLEIKKIVRNKSKKSVHEDGAEIMIDGSSSLMSESANANESIVKDVSPVDNTDGNKIASCDLDLSAALDTLGSHTRQDSSNSSTHGLVLVAECSAPVDGNMAENKMPVLGAVPQVASKQETSCSPANSADCVEYLPVKSEENENKVMLVEGVDQKVISINQKCLSSVILLPTSSRTQSTKARTQDGNQTPLISPKRKQQSVKTELKNEHSPLSKAKNVSNSLHTTANGRESKVSNYKHTFRSHRKVHSDAYSSKSKRSRTDDSRKPKREIRVLNASETYSDTSENQKKKHHSSPTAVREKHNKSKINDGHENKDYRGGVSSIRKEIGNSSNKQTKKYGHTRDTLSNNKHTNGDRKLHHYHNKTTQSAQLGDNRHARSDRHTGSAKRDDRKKSDNKNRPRKRNKSPYDNRKKDDNASKDTRKKDVNLTSDGLPKHDIKRKTNNGYEKSDVRCANVDVRKVRTATLVKEKCKKSDDATTKNQKKCELKQVENNSKMVPYDKIKLSHANKKDNNTEMTDNSNRNVSSGDVNELQHRKDDNTGNINCVPDVNVPKPENKIAEILDSSNTLHINKDETLKTKEPTTSSTEPLKSFEDVEDGEIVSDESDDEEKPRRFNKLENSRTPIKSVITSPGFKRRISSIDLRRRILRDDDRILQANRRKMEQRRQSVLIEKAKEMARRRLDRHKIGASSITRRYTHFERSAHSRIVDSKPRYSDRKTSSHNVRK